MLEFQYSWLLAALPAPLLVYWLLPPHREQVSAIRVPFFAELVQATGGKARSAAVVLSRRALQVGAMALIWCLLVAGLAGPEWVGEPIERTEAARDIMLAVDLSGSMAYRDFVDGQGRKSSRFEAVQRVVDQFVANREQDRIGLIVFGTRAYLQLPFTRDLEAARALVQLMDVAMAGPKTALGDAIGLAIRTFQESDVDVRMLILLTDGNDTASRMTPVNAAEIAASQGLEIHTIGIGDRAATGEDRVDFDALESIAQRTGGQFFNAEDEAGLIEIYERIDEFAPGEIKTRSWRPRQSLVHWPAGAAAVIGLVGTLLMLWFSSRRQSA